MKYMIDTADIDSIKKLYNFFPLSGVTTNPSILKEAGGKLTKTIDNILKVIGSDMIHVQMISQKSKDIVREAKMYKDYFNTDDSYYDKHK